MLATGALGMQNSPTTQENAGEAGRDWRWPLALALVVLAFYLRCVYFEFLNWDDDPLLTNNPLTRSFSFANLLGLFRPGAIPKEQLYIPLTYLSHLFENSLFGLRPGVVHGINVLLHLLNTLLVYRLLKCLGASRLVGFVAALVFAIHPLQVEVVAWAMGRKDLLSTALALGALLCWRRWLRDFDRRDYFAAYTLWVAAMLAKPSMLVLPGLFVLLDFYCRDRVTRADWLNKAPMLIAMLLILGVNIWLGKAAQGMPSLGYRLAAVPWVLSGWAARILLLAEPSQFYAWPETGAGRLLLSGLPFCVGMGILLVCAFRLKWRNCWFGLTFFAIAFAPAVGIVLNYRKFITADRYGYFPLIGIFFIAAMLVPVFRGRGRKIYLAVLSLWLLFGGWRTWRLTGEWRSSVSLWQAVLRKNSQTQYAWRGLSVALRSAGQTSASMETSLKLLRLNRSSCYALLSLGVAYEEKDELTKAEVFYRHTIRVKPEHDDAWRLLAGVLLKRGQHEESVKASQQALSIQPGNAEALQNLGAAYFYLEDYPKALKCFDKQKKLTPDNAVLHKNIGLVYFQQERFQEAESCFRQALKFKPDLLEAHLQLGQALIKQNKLAEACAAYREVLRLQPDHAWARQVLEKLEEKMRPQPPKAGPD